MIFRELTKENKDYQRLKTVYDSSFPRAERANFHWLVRGGQRPGVDCLALYEEQQCVGMALLITDETLAYLCYLVIDPAMRGTGCGSRAVQGLLERYAGKKLFLAREKEDPNADNATQRVRRHQFYLRAGLKDLPHTISEYGVRMAVMGTAPVEPKEYDRIIRVWLGPLRCFLWQMKMLPD